METYSFKAIGDAIYNKMLEIKNTDQRVGAVYNYDIKVEGGISLPAIIITPGNGTSGYLDTCNYTNQVNYEVRLVDRIQDDIATVEDNIRVVADMVMAKLQELGTITRTNNNWYTVKCEFDYLRGFTDTQEPLRVFQVTCKFITINK